MQIFQIGTLPSHSIYGFSSATIFGGLEGEGCYVRIFCGLGHSGSEPIRQINVPLMYTMSYYMCKRICYYSLVYIMCLSACQPLHVQQ